MAAFTGGPPICTDAESHAYNTLLSAIESLILFLVEECMHSIILMHLKVTFSSHSVVHKQNPERHFIHAILRKHDLLSKYSRIDLTEAFFIGSPICADESHAHPATFQSRQ